MNNQLHDSHVQARIAYLAIKQMVWVTQYSGATRVEDAWADSMFRCAKKDINMEMLADFCR